jgi:hypothetical protein
MISLMLPRRFLRFFVTPRVAILSLTCLVAISAATAQADPHIKDQAMAQKLLGKHALTLQWLGTGTLSDAGTAEVTDENGGWHLTGKQQAKEGYVTLDGTVTEVDAKTFAFTGKIITNVSYINQGKDCLRNGDFTFAQKGNRKYWRMQQIDNPCDEAADYVDIYLR